MEEDSSARISVLQESLRRVEKAMELQAREYERRLDELNHERAREKDTLNTYLPREVYERSEDRLRSWTSEVDGTLKVQQGKDSGKAAVWAAIFAVVAFLVSLAGLVVKFVR